MTQDERILIRQVEMWARLNQTACRFIAKGDEDTDPGRPFFIIDTALHGCGYRPCTTDWNRWNVVARWMYGNETDRHYAETPTRTFCEDPFCDKSH